LRIVKTDTGPQNEYALIPQNIHEVRGDLQVPLIFRRTWLLSGQVKAAAGSTLPTSQLFSLHATETTKGVERYQASLMLKAPDYTWSTRVAEGATLELSYTAQATAAGVPVDYLALFQNFEPKNVVFNPLLSGLPSLLAYGPEHVDEGEAFPVIVQLSDYAGTNGVSFRYRTVDGSAKAGTDYVAVSGTARIEAGEYYKFIDLQLPANDRKPEQPAYFDVVIDQISGATGATMTVRTWISDDDHRTGGTLPPTSP
jgi:hypothetical protein